jgi:hypothetical protein
MESDMAGLFHVLKGQPDGTFKKADSLKGIDDKLLIIPADKEKVVEKICTRPYAVDWDGDGDVDLVVGNFAGTFYLFKGEGKGKYAPEPEQLKADDKPLQIKGHHSDPFVIDWDGDGDLDLLSGSTEGGLQWAENTAGKKKTPELKPFRELIKPEAPSQYGGMMREADLKGPASATRVWIDDVNGDGKLDVLVGDLVTLVTPADKVSEDEFKAKFAAWQGSMAEATKELSSTSVDEKARTEAIQKYQKLAREKNEFMKEDRTGFVWLYLRK